MRKRMQMDIQRIRRLLAAGLIFAALTGCATNAAPPAQQPVAEAPEAGLAESEEPEVLLPYTYPLTGLPAAERLMDRPMVVMVENSPAARPQTGLHEADIVYEVLAEGDITRFIAIYHSAAAEVIGPVRSIRPYFVELGQAVDGILVHAGWSQEAMNLMVRHKLNHLDQVYGDHDYYWRDKSRKAPHNLYTSVELIRKGAEAKKFRATWTDPVLTFKRAEQKAGAGAIGGETAESVTIPYLQSYTVGYSYDKAAGTYLRSMKGEAHNDKETGERLSAANVLIVEAKHRVVDSVGRRDVDVQGPGSGYLLQEGVKRDIVWKLRDGIIRAYENADGAREMPLVPGKTWVQIVPDLKKVAFE